MKKGIAILDNKIYFRNRIQQLVMNKDIEVYGAKNSRELFEILANNKNKIDLLISEVNLGKEDGVEVIKSFKKRNNDIPVMIITAENKKKFFIKSIKAGVIDYVLIPFDEQLLLDRILNSIENKSYYNKNINNKKKESNKNKKENKKQISDIQQFISQGISGGKHVFSLFMIVLYSIEEQSSQKSKDRYAALIDELYKEFRKIFKDANTYMKFSSESIIGTFPFCSKENEDNITRSIKNKFYQLKKEDKKYKSQYIEIVFVNYPEDGKTKKELINKSCKTMKNIISENKGK